MAATTQHGRTPDGKHTEQTLLNMRTVKMFVGSTSPTRINFRNILCYPYQPDVESKTTLMVITAQRRVAKLTIITARVTAFSTDDCGA